MSRELKHTSRRAVGCAMVLMGALLSGCATGPQANPRDPLEPLNRGVYGFNDALDKAVIKPTATVYRNVLPSFVRTGVGNFFGNLEDVWSMVNNLLQFKGEGAANSLVRVSMNTVFGFGGVIDLASELNIERHYEDFGQTLGYWGVGAGPYIVLPLFGPSTLRDTAAMAVDTKGDLVMRIEDVPTRNSLKALNLIDTRAVLLRASSVIEGAALDPYTFTRDAYLQRRRNDVFDGSPPDDVPDPSQPAP
jgi:phospholipid-binding lipoprotein MlaA